jgi:hypothetical protein
MQVTDGLTNNGETLRFTYDYDSALQKSAANPNGPEPARTNALIAASEDDYNLMAGWFGGISLSGYNLPISVSITSDEGGADWGTVGAHTGMTIHAGLRDAIHCRYLFVAETTELFMSSQRQGWFAPDGSNEQSCGEGLSRFLAMQFLERNGIDIVPPNFAVSQLWLNSARVDFVNNTVEHDHLPDATSGCATLFIYYLYSQLGFSISEIVGAAPGIDKASSCLRGVYQKLTRDTSDPFPFFKRLLDIAFPPNNMAVIPGPNQDNPFPLTTMTIVPDCTGASEGLAIQILAQAGLRLGTATTIRPTVPNPPFAVTSQDPLPNTEVLLDTAVDLVLRPHRFHDPHPRIVPPPR